MEEYIVIIDDWETIRWYQNKKLSRFGGPAIEYKDGSKFWCQEGKLHKIDGPAVNDINGYKAWYIEGKKYSQDEFNKIINPKTKELTIGEICSLLGYKIKIVG